MPRARPEPIEEYLLDLEEAGLELPDGLSPPQAYRLAAAGAFFARRKKKVEFHAADLLRVVDRRAEVDVPLVSILRASDVEGALAYGAQVARASPRRTVLWLDATSSPDGEHLFEHALWGEVTLYAWPSKPRRPTNERVLAAERAGWTPVLKQFNLLPGRGLIVEDHQLGLLATSPHSPALAGVVAHVGSGEAVWCPNPFVEERFADADFQYWLKWGPGTDPTEWREVLRHGQDPA